MNRMRKGLRGYQDIINLGRIIAILLLGFVSTTIYARPKTLKIISYNVYDSFQGREDIKALFETWVQEQNPDVIAFQEIKGYTEDSFNTFSKRLGFSYSALQREKGHSVAFMSKFPVSEVHKVTKDMHHGYMSVKILNYRMVVVHLAPFTWQQRNKEMDSLIVYLKKNPGERILVMGDFNAMSPADSLAYGEEKIKMMKDTERRIERIRNLKEGRIDYAPMQKILNNGFVDTWRLFHNIYERSAPTKVKNHNNYTRIDYILVSKNMRKRCVEAYMIKDVATNKISDHYPQVLILRN